MSGGSLNYAYLADEVNEQAYEQAIQKLEACGHQEAAEMLRKVLRSHRETYLLHCNARRLMHAVEWTLSGDWGEDQLAEVCRKEVEKYGV